MSSSEAKKVMLMSLDDELFEVEEAVAMESNTIKHRIEEGTLMSSDDDLFEVEEAVAMESTTIKHRIGEDYSEEEGITVPELITNMIRLPEVTSKILIKVIEYCKKHAAAKINDWGVDGDLKKWDAEFVKLNQNILSDLKLAADYLDIKSLLDLLTENDSTSEHEKEVTEENPSAFCASD